MRRLNALGCIHSNAIYGNIMFNSASGCVLGAISHYGTTILTREGDLSISGTSLVLDSSFYALFFVVPCVAMVTLSDHLLAPYENLCGDLDAYSEIKCDFAGRDSFLMFF